MGGWRIGVVMSWEGGGRMGEGREIRITITITITIEGQPCPSVVHFSPFLIRAPQRASPSLCTLNSALFSTSVPIREIRGFSLSISVLSGYAGSGRFSPRDVALPESRLDRCKVLIDSVRMKNITVSVGDEVYHRARVRAAELRTSVSAIVRKILEDVAAEETESERLKRLECETIDRIQARGRGFSASNRLSREQIHERNALR